jgi:hypothetical protein
LSASIDGVLAHFLFNRDDVGCYDWMDRVDSDCAIPAECGRPSIHLPVPPTADGSYLRLGVMVARRAFEDELVTFGLLREKAEFSRHGRSFIEANILRNWFRDVSPLP